MGFAVIGYPTKRQNRRSIHDQLPYKLRSEQDNKNDIARQISIRGRRKKNIRNLKKKQLINQKLKELNTFDKNNDKWDQQLIESTWVRRNVNTQYAMVQTRPNWLSQVNTVMRSRGSNTSVSNQKEVWSYYTGKDIRFERWQPSQLMIQSDLMSNAIDSKDNGLLLKVRKETKPSNGKIINSMESKVHKVSKGRKKAARKSKDVVYDKLSFDYNSNNLNESDSNSEDDLKNSADLKVRKIVTMLQQSSNNSQQKQTNEGNSKITKKLSLDKLPPEIIQKIFIFSLANYNMLLTNKYLNHCLKLSDHLLEHNFIENYIHVMDNNIQENIDSMLIRVKYLNTRIFDDPVMTQFFLRRLKHLKKKFNRFITDEIINKGLTVYKNPSLPHRLYVSSINYYFKNIHILKYFFKNFEVVVSSLIDNIIDWFFQFQTNYNIQDFLHVMKIIKRYCKKYDYLKDKVNFTAHHLVSILEHLFLSDNNKQLVTIDFFQGLSSYIELEGKKEEEGNIHKLPLEKLKINLVDVYLSMFYKPLVIDNGNHDSDINTVLNDSSLWSCLKNISNIELIDVFVSHGIRPSYGHII